MLATGITLYFVRHGDTDWNGAKLYQGKRDIPLKAKAREQARRNGGALNELLGRRATSIDYVASPLMRARETMEIMRDELALPREGYRTDDRLCEIHYGH